MGITLSMEKHWSHTGKSADNFPATPQGEFLGCIRKSLNKLKKSSYNKKQYFSIFYTFWLPYQCVCGVCGFRRLVNTDMAVMVLPSSRLIGWEVFVSMFALVNERKEGESIQYTLIHTLSVVQHCQDLCVRECVFVLRVTALSLPIHPGLISSLSLSKHGREPQRNLTCGRKEGRNPLSITDQEMQNGRTLQDIPISPGK